MINKNLLVIDYTHIFILRICETSTLRESVRIWSYSGPQFPPFGLNTERYSVYREILRIFPYLVRMQENDDENNTEYGHSLRSGTP